MWRDGFIEGMACEEAAITVTVSLFGIASAELDYPIPKHFWRLVCYIREAGETGICYQKDYRTCVMPFEESISVLVEYGLATYSEKNNLDCLTLTELGLSCELAV